MKVVILAGGFGTRISEESDYKPKPMIRIGDYPILWHIMKIYSHYGHNDFIIPLGYKGEEIKEYFINYSKYKSNLEIDLNNDSIKILKRSKEIWKITLVDTGLDTMTGGRIKKIKKYIGNERFFLTYGDGLSNININKLLKFHNLSKKIVTLSAIKFKGRYGSIKIKENNVESFQEKPDYANSWINGGFFVCEPSVFEFIKNNKTVFERDPIENICSKNKLGAFKHNGFWHPLDNVKDKRNLEKLWLSTAPWKIWKT